MLKIKDNVDLKELEKYGLEYYKIYRVYSNENTYCLSTEVKEENRIIYLQDERFAYEDDIDVLYDLIKDGLVEKVD